MTEEVGLSDFENESHKDAGTGIPESEVILCCMWESVCVNNVTQKFGVFGIKYSFYSTFSLVVLPEYKWNSFEKSEFEVIFCSVSDSLFVNTLN